MKLIYDNINSEYYVNKESFIFKDINYPSGIVFKKHEFYFSPIYLFYKGKIKNCKLPDVKKIEGFPISFHLSFKEHDKIIELNIPIPEMNYEYMLKHENRYKEKLLSLWFEIVYPLYQLQENSYYLFENHFCFICCQLLMKFTEYNPYIKQMFTKYFLNIFQFISLFEKEEITKNPFLYINENEELLENKLLELEEELKIRNELLIKLKEE